MLSAKILWQRYKTCWVLILLVAGFLLVRLPALHSPFHQDEYKWPMSVDSRIVPPVTIPHPPLGQAIYRLGSKIVGLENFRVVPLFFGVLNLILLFFLVRRKFDFKTAVVSGVIFSAAYFNILASLMIDTDGQIMPFFFLSALLCYYKWRDEPRRKFKWLWVSLLGVALLGGLFIKVSFVLAVGAIALAFVYENRQRLNWKALTRYAGVLGGFLVIVGVLIFASRYLFPEFDFSGSVKYWEHFAVWADRGWLQIAIQCIKAVLYLSPFLILAPFFMEKNEREKTAALWLFSILAFIFYVLAFDFSLGALDRYLQLYVMPLSIMAGVVVTRLLSNLRPQQKRWIVGGGLILAAGLILLQFLPHTIPPLHPKTAWLNRIFTLRWNFLYPFSGGSGPLGFYVSWLFIGMSWVISLGLFIAALLKKRLRVILFGLMLIIGAVYNLTFTEEYLFGRINGNAPDLVRRATEFIKNNDTVNWVTVFNDNGGYNVMSTGKYRKRLYIDPKFDETIKIANLNKYKEFYLVIDIPRIDPHSIFQKYWDGCQIFYQDKSRQINSTLYDCRAAPDVK